MGRMTLYQRWGEVTLSLFDIASNNCSEAGAPVPPPSCHPRLAAVAPPASADAKSHRSSADALPRRPVKGVGAGGERAPGVGEVAGAEEEVGCAAPACLLSPKGREAGGRASPRRHHGAAAGSSSPSPCLAPTAGGVFEARRGCGP
jgi:hypothetical protein